MPGIVEANRHEVFDRAILREMGEMGFIAPELPERLGGQGLGSLAAGVIHEEIARADLRLRGMGDLFGERQSGEAMFRIANPLEDVELGELAREGAETLLANDPDLRLKANTPLHDILRKRYARALELFRVG